ncbi:hypothetical protein ABE430_26855, partial [Brevibacillus agri]
HKYGLDPRLPLKRSHQANRWSRFASADQVNKGMPAPNKSTAYSRREAPGQEAVSPTGREVA